MSPAEQETKEYEGFVDLGVDTEDVHEPQPLPTGAYNLTVSSAKAIFADKEDGTRYLKQIRCMIDFDDHKNAATMFHNLQLPQPDEDAKKKNFKVMMIKKFYKLFNVPISGKGVNTTDLIGARATQAFVELTEYDKGDGTPPRISNQLNLQSVKV
jgi:hypothetical protein